MCMRKEMLEWTAELEAKDINECKRLLRIFSRYFKGDIYELHKRCKYGFEKMKLAEESNDGKSWFCANEMINTLIRLDSYPRR